MRACPSCGEENPERARFCLACGTSLEVAVPPREERKVITALFVDLVGFTSRSEQLDPEDVGRILTPYYGRVRSELERFGGTVEKFIGDAVVALFGAPVAHEDDPERAVRAAFAIRRAIAEFNEADPQLDLHIRIGVNTGEALVATAGLSEGEGMAAGDVVNTCARLQSAAPTDGVLVGEATFRATSRSIEYRLRDPIQAKGKAEPVRVWEAVAARTRSRVDLAGRGRAPLVGREDELRSLLRAVERARAGSLQLVTLLGAPGMGKSRLLVEFLAALESARPPVTWLQGRSLSYGGRVLGALADIVRSSAGIEEDDALDVASRKLRGAVDLVLGTADADWVERHLRSLVGLGDDQDAADDHRTEAFGAWRRFVEALSLRRPLVLVLEDLHCADDTLLDFIEHLVEWSHGLPIVVLCGARPELLERRPAWRERSTEICLTPLGDDEATRLISALVEGARLPTALHDRLVTAAGGNPLYAEEFVRMLTDRHVLDEDGAARIDAADLPLPESVQGIIAARLDALSRHEKTATEDGAVVGDVVWTGCLARLSDLDTPSVELSLTELQRKEVLHREPVSIFPDEPQYAFRHALIRDVAYRQIPRARRAIKHRSVAEWLESVAAREERVEMLAHHYCSALEYALATRQETGRLRDNARTALKDAGDRAFTLNAFSDAARFYARAIDLWPEDADDRAELLFRHGKALFHADESGAEQLERARDAFLATGDRSRAAEAEIVLARLFGAKGQGELASEHDARAAALIADASASQSKAYVLSRLAGAAVNRGDSRGAIQLGGEALGIARHLELEELEAHALDTIGTARFMLGDLTGLSDLEDSVRLSESIGSAESVRAYINLSEASVQLGRLPQAFQLRERAMSSAERFGDAALIRWLRGERVAELYWRGRWDEAVAEASSFISEADSGRRHYLEETCRRVRAHVRLARGDLSGALSDAMEGVAFARDTEDPELLRLARSFQARALAKFGRRGDARAVVESVLDDWARNDEPFVLNWVVDLAFAAVDLGLQDEVLKALATPTTSTAWLGAAMALAHGEFQRAVDIFGAIGTRPDEAYARLLAAKQAASVGSKSVALEQFRRAQDFYRAVKAEGYAREGEELLALSASK